MIDSPRAYCKKARQCALCTARRFRTPVRNGDLRPAAALAEAVKSSAPPDGTRDGVNDWKRTGGGGPCPPIGRHRYFHKRYAVDTVLPDLKRPDESALEKAMQGYVLAQTVLLGIHQRAMPDAAI